MCIDYNKLWKKTCRRGSNKWNIVDEWNWGWTITDDAKFSTQVRLHISQKREFIHREHCNNTCSSKQGIEMLCVKELSPQCQQTMGMEILQYCIKPSIYALLSVECFLCSNALNVIKQINLSWIIAYTQWWSVILQRYIKRPTCMSSMPLVCVYAWNTTKENVYLTPWVEFCVAVVYYKERTREL